MTKTARREKNQAIAAELKRLGIERTQGRCCGCYAVYHADMLGRGYQSHLCSKINPRKR